MRTPVGLLLFCRIDKQVQFKVDVLASSTVFNMNSPSLFCLQLRGGKARTTDFSLTTINAILPSASGGLIQVNIAGLLWKCS